MSYQPGSSNQNESDNHHEKCWIYNPYQDLRVPIQTLYKLPTSLEYLFQEESIAQRLGAGKGLVEGVKASEAGGTMKLRVNHILNAFRHADRTISNRAGVIRLLYTGMESRMVKARDADNIINSVVAGLATGALYKVASIARSIGGIAVGLAMQRKQILKRYVPI
ncbi:unnamed protein product [Lactuca saligna]|uniref:Uncharacterized protein n=1 Tax=Lactuca saligna TaxID=75948 RepID=A0AA35V1R5_LACSI|nr:unnamed protein product [Lactuca saligna]